MPRVLVGGAFRTKNERIHIHTNSKYFCTTIATYCADLPFLIIGALSTYTCTNINQICTCFVFDNFIVFKSACLCVGGWGAMGG